MAKPGLVRRNLTADNLAQGIVSAVVSVAVAAGIGAALELPEGWLVGLGIATFGLVLAGLLHLRTRAIRASVSTEAAAIREQVNRDVAEGFARGWRGTESEPNDPTDAASERGWVSKEELDRYLQGIKETMERHGFGSQPPSSEPKSKTAEPPPTPPKKTLDGDQRDRVRAFIREGEELLALGDKLQRDSVHAWRDRVSAWIQRATTQVTGLRFEMPTRRIVGPVGELQIYLERLRSLLLDNIPPGVSHLLTPLEALDRYMEVKAIPEGDRPQLRKLAEELFKGADDQ